MMANMRIAIGSDHARFELKEAVKAFLWMGAGHCAERSLRETEKAARVLGLTVALIELTQTVGLEIPR